MKRYFNFLFVMPLLFSLSSCALFESSNNDKNIVSLSSLNYGTIDFFIVFPI